MFRFKRFIVNQHGAAMKVGTDGVLLGAWAKLRPQHCRYLDIGTGTGLIALMLAQRTESVGAEIDAGSCGQPGASGDSTGKDKGICSQSGSGWYSTVTDIDNNGLHAINRTGMRYGNSTPNNISVIIDAVDIDESSCVQAQENVAASEWGGRINIFNASIQQFAAKSIMKNYEIEQFTEDNIAVPIDLNTALYDHIVSNPPYFVDSLLPATHSRSVARHTKSLPYNELLSSVSHLLAPAGVFSVIIPFGNHQGFIQAAAVEGLVPTRRCMVFPLAGKPCKRVLLEFAHASFVKRDASCQEQHADSLERDASVPEHYADSLERDASCQGQCTSYPLQIEDTELVIESLPDNFTPEYMALTRDFYLKF